MKRITMATVLLLAAALQLAASINYNSSKSNTGNFALSCTGLDEKTPCSEKEVNDVNDWLASFAGKRQHGQLADIKAVTLASPKDGGLKCEQNNGAAGTAEQQKALAQFYKPVTAAPPAKKQK